jgi:hypothetical protein
MFDPHATVPPWFRTLPLVCAAALATLIAAVPPPAFAGVRAYPAPEGVAPDDEYEVTVDGQPVFVYKNPVAALASFDMEGPVEVVIRPRRDPQWVDVRPSSAKIRARIEEGLIKFKLDRPRKLSVELNQEPDRHPLFVFANEVGPGPPAPGTPGVHHFAAGKVHKPGIIEVKSGESVYIAGGAVVEAAITGEKVEDVRIFGRGILDGTSTRSLPWPEGVRFRRLIHFRDSKNITLEGVTLSNGTTWQVVPVNCEDVNIRNIKIVSGNGSDDGIDVVRSRRVRIEDVFLRTKDDNVAVKSLFDYPPEVGVKDVLVTKSVLWNAEWGNALEIGFELRSAFVENVVFKDLDVIRVQRGAVLSIHNGDTSVVRNIRFEDIRIENADHKLMDVAIFLSRYSADAPRDPKVRDARYLHGAWDGVLRVGEGERAAHASHRGHVRHIVFRNIHVVAGGLPFSVFHGFDADHRVEGVEVQNLTFHGRRLRDRDAARFRVQHADVKLR